MIDGIRDDISLCTWQTATVQRLNERARFLGASECMASACTDSKNSKSCVQKRMVGRFLDFTDRRTIRPTWYVASVIKRGSVRKGSKVACEELKELEVMCGSACGGERTLSFCVFLAGGGGGGWTGQFLQKKAVFTQI